MGKSSPSPAVRAFARQALLPRLDALEGQWDGVRAAQDIEAIHRMRVATRRLRAALPQFADCFRKRDVRRWKMAVRALTRALGAARDADVQIETVDRFLAGHPAPDWQPGLLRLRLRLAQHRDRLQASVLQALDEARESGALSELRRRLTALPETLEPAQPVDPALRLRAQTAVLQRREALLDFQPYVDLPEASEQLHAMRIAAKRLRYTLELYAPLDQAGFRTPLQALRTIQEALGDLHDSDVWLDWLPRFRADEQRRTDEFFGEPVGIAPLLPGLAAFENSCRQTRAAAYAAFTAAWHTAERQELWSALAWKDG